MGHDAQVCSVSFSSDGRWLATAAQDRTIILWEVGDHAVMRDWSIDDQVNVDPGAVYITFSPRGQWLASSGTDRFIRIWDVENLDVQEPHAILVHTSTVSMFAWQSAGVTFASIANDGIVRLWHTDTFQELRRFSLHNFLPVGGASFFLLPRYGEWLCSPDGQWLFLEQSGSARAKVIWDISRGCPRVFLQQNEEDASFTMTTAVFSQNSQLISAVSFLPTARDLIRVWDVTTGKLLARMTILRDTYSRPPGTVVFSPSGCLALYHNCDTSSPAHIWDVNTGRGHRSLSLPSYSCQSWGTIQAACFSPDDRHIATASKDGVWIWRTDDGRRVTFIKNDSEEVGDNSYLGFSPDGRALVSADALGAVHIHPLKHLIRGWPDV